MRIARELQLAPATPDEAREILGTRGRAKREPPMPVIHDEAFVVPSPEEAQFTTGEFHP